MAPATYPEVERDGPPLLPYLVLLRMGFALPDELLRPRCALTAPFHPYPNRQAGCGRYIFCGTFRKVRFERTPPAVSRHAALWRPDFPPAIPCAVARNGQRSPNWQTHLILSQNCVNYQTSVTVYVQVSVKSTWTCLPADLDRIGHAERKKL